MRIVRYGITPFFLLLFILRTVFSDERNLPNEIFGFQLGSSYNELFKSYSLKRIKPICEVVKTYQIVYNEPVGVETFISFFNKKVYKISLVYKRDFADITDWENIFYQAEMYYHQPDKVFVEQKENYYIENYQWETPTIKYVLQKVNQDNELESFSIVLTDKNVEQYITSLPLTKKIYYKIISIFTP